MLRSLSRIASGILLIVAVLFCLPGRGMAGQHPGKTTLRLWHPWTTDGRKILESIIDEFNCRHPDSELSAIPAVYLGGSSAERMLMSSTADGLPELMVVKREAIPPLADAGIIRPLEELFHSSDRLPGALRKENLLDSARLYGSYDDKLYGLPVCLNPFVLAYSPESLAAAGISAPPREWKDFEELSGKVRNIRASDDGRHRWILSVRSMAPLFHILCIQNGIEPYALATEDERVGKLVEILDFIRSLRRDLSLLPPQYKYGDPNFVDLAGGKVLFQVEDAVMLSYLIKSTSVPIEASMIPSDSVSHGTYLSSSPVFVMPSSKGGNEGAVIEFLEFFYSPEQYARFAEQFLFVSPVKTALPEMETGVSNKRLYSQLVRAAEDARVYPLHPYSGTVLPRVARIIEKLDAGLFGPERTLKALLKAADGKDERASVFPQPPVRISWAQATRRLFADDGPALRNAPIKIVAARNEHEAFQLALSAEGRMDGLRMAMTPFVSGDGTSHKPDMSACLEVDTVISDPLVARDAGAYPNVLEPLGEFCVSPGALTRIWVDTFTPADVPPGEYISRIRIRQGDLDVAEVPVHLRVLPLKIPSVPSQPASIGLNYELIANYYGSEEGSEGYRELMDSFYWFLVERRMSPYGPPVALDSPEVADYLNDKRVSTCRLPFHPRDPRFRTAVELGRKGGWLGKLYVYFADEPIYHNYRMISEAGNMIHSLSAPPRLLVTCFPDRPLFGAVDIWGVHMRFLPQGIPHGSGDRSMYLASVYRRLRKGDEVWWYTAGAVRPFPTLHIEDDPSAFRIIPWLQQLYRIGGFLHWEAANWGGSFDDPFVQFFGNGEGVLVYPGASKPNSSIRLELLREGLEDLEYLMLLRLRIEGLQKRLKAEQLGNVASVRIREMCRRLISAEALRAHACDAFILLPHFTREPGRIEQTREEVAEETIALEMEPLALVLTEPEEKQYTVSNNARIFGVVERGCNVEVNGRPLAVDGDGGFSGSFPLSSGTNVFRVGIENGENSKVVVREIERL